MTKFQNAGPGPGPGPSPSPGPDPVVVVPPTREVEKNTKAKVGVRLGMGAQFKLYENLAARLIARYQKGNQVIKDVKSVGLAVLYQF